MLADSADDLNNSLQALNEYCKKWKLCVNFSKTKVVVFSRGRVRRLPSFTIDGHSIDVVYQFKYLGLVMNYNGRFVEAVKNLCNRASRAMFCVLQKVSKFCLSVDTALHLFSTMVKPILLYGCEVWGAEGKCVLAQIEKVQLKFCKMILNLKQSTSTKMILAETGLYPLEMDVKIRMVSYWSRQVQCNDVKLSNAFMKIGHVFDCDWLKYVKCVIDQCGLSYLWHGVHRVNIEWLKYKIHLCLHDQFVQEWKSNIDDMSSCNVYASILNANVYWEIQKYLIKLPVRYRTILCRFRCRNSKLPIVRASYDNTYSTTCPFCDYSVCDEPHVILFCPYFSDMRKKYLPKYFINNPNMGKFVALFGLEKMHLINLCKFIECINALF